MPIAPDAVPRATADAVPPWLDAQGLRREPALPLRRPDGASTLFVGSTASRMLPFVLGAEAYPGGLYALQPCLRTALLDDDEPTAPDVAARLGSISSFTMCGTLERGGLTGAVLARTHAFLTDVLGLDAGRLAALCPRDRPDLQRLVRATLPGLDARVPREVGATTWRYGVDGLRGHGVVFLARTAAGHWVQVGDAVEITNARAADPVAARWVETGVGLESAAAARAPGTALIDHAPIAAAGRALGVPAVWAGDVFLDALQGSFEMAGAGVRWSECRGGRWSHGRILKRYAKTALVYGGAWLAAAAPAELCADYLARAPGRAVDPEAARTIAEVFAWQRDVVAASERRFAALAGRAPARHGTAELAALGAREFGLLRPQIARIMAVAP